MAVQQTAQCVILGCGYTGRRVARRMAGRGFEVVATTRSPERWQIIPGVRVVSLEECEVQPGALVLHSIPPVDDAEPVTPRLIPLLRHASRVVYLSTTGVYGDQHHVDENTKPAPRSRREQARVDEENLVRAGKWPSLILRPAAIYGPGRGVHVAMAEGRHRLWNDGSNYISRIHVEDLAAHVEAGLLAELTGAYPVADEEPCRAIEIARFCAERMNVPMPPAETDLDRKDTRRANRRVDGGAIRRLLKIELLYPSYRSGIPAAFAEEAAQMNL